MLEEKKHLKVFWAGKKLSCLFSGAEPIRLLGPSGEQRPLSLLGRHCQNQRGGDGLSHTGEHHGDDGDGDDGGDDGDDGRNSW